MRKYLIIALAIPLGSLARAEAKTMTAGELFEACTSTIKTASGVCTVYMAGFMAGMNVEQLTRGDGPQKVCMPEGITGERVKAVFEGFMRDYPKMQKGEAEPSLTIGFALFRAYPCPGTIK